MIDRVFFALLAREIGSRLLTASHRTSSFDSFSSDLVFWQLGILVNYSKLMILHPVIEICCACLVRLNAVCPSKKSARPWRLFSWQEFGLLSELTRQIHPPSKNSHATSPTLSRKSFSRLILRVSGSGTGRIDSVCGIKRRR